MCGWVGDKPGVLLRSGMIRSCGSRACKTAVLHKDFGPGDRPKMLTSGEYAALVRLTQLAVSVRCRKGRIPGACRAAGSTMLDVTAALTTAISLAKGLIELATAAKAKLAASELMSQLADIKVQAAETRIELAAMKDENARVKAELKKATAAPALVRKGACFISRVVMGRSTRRTFSGTGDTFHQPAAARANGCRTTTHNWTRRHRPLG